MRKYKRFIRYTSIFIGISIILTILITLTMIVIEHNKEIKFYGKEIYKLQKDVNNLKDDVKNCNKEIKTKTENIIELQSNIIKLEKEKNKIVREVLVTAYNSVPDQTDDTPFEAAWGDNLEEGMKIIAVSRDLEKVGLTRGTIVHVDGLGEYKVLDRMHYRKTNQIDIYMGTDVRKARKFGVKNLKIKWFDNIKGEGT